jgi:hypothetical protein
MSEAGTSAMRSIRPVFFAIAGEANRGGRAAQTGLSEGVDAARGRRQPVAAGIMECHAERKQRESQ